MAKKKASYGPYKGYYPQTYLFRYLEIDLDPYDFPQYMLEEWAQENDVKLEEDTYVSDITDDQRKAFEQWLRANSKEVELLERDPAGAPAYLTLRYPELAPKGTWAIHYTNEGTFKSFEHGATRDRLALSTWYKEKEVARCDENLTDELGDAEYVYIFAFKADRYSLSYGTRKYGKNAVLFQTDAGVEAYHIGDEEHQLIVPACSEYNVIPLRRVDEGVIVCSFEGDEDKGLEFETIEALITYVETEEKKGNRPLARIKC